MTLALQHTLPSNPSGINLASLTVLDMAPRHKSLQSVFHKYVGVMRDLDSSDSTSHRDLDKKMMTALDDRGVRSFLLTNFKPANTMESRASYEKAFPEEEQYAQSLSTVPPMTLKCRLNLASIEKYLPHLWSFPPSLASPSPVFKNPTLFIAASKVQYIVKNDIPEIKRFFPNSFIEWLDTGHWIHAEKPNEVVELIRAHVSRE